MPWKGQKNAYKIWLSEIILQQTRVQQGLSYYNKFVSKYPEVKKLARAGEDDVLKLWQGLGYYRRAKMLHRNAQVVCAEHNGKLPQTVKELLPLPGIGRYTAGAVASIAFEKKAPLLDGNVIHIDDVATADLTPQDREYLVTGNRRSWLGVPLLSAGRTIGVDDLALPAQGIKPVVSADGILTLDLIPD